RLAPTRTDYETLYADIHAAAEEALLADLERVMNELLERAWREPGRLHEEHVEIGELGLGILVFESGEYRVVILPLIDERNHAVPEDILLLLVRAAFGKDCRLEDLEAADPGVLGSMGYRPRLTDWALAQLRE